MRRVDTFLLASIGVLVLHQIAYVITGSFATVVAVDHSHLAVAWNFGSVVMLLGLARAIVVSVKRRRHANVHIGYLTAAIAVGFVALEQVERLAAGYGATALFGEPVLWVALVIAPIVATVLSRSIRTVTQLAVDWAAPAFRSWFAVRIDPPRQVVLVPAHVVHRRATPRRGPPVR